MRSSFIAYLEKHIGRDVAEVYELNQLLLPQEGRVVPGSMQCLVRQGSFICTLPHRHNCQHIAHNLQGNIVGRWDF